MRKYKLDWSSLQPNPINTMYGDGRLSFAFMSKPDKNRYIKLVSRFIRCRETLANQLWHHFSHHFSEASGRRLSNLDISKTRLAARIIEKSDPIAQKNFSEGMDLGLSAINLIETEVNWPLTKMYNVSHKEDPRMHIRYLVANKKWMLSSHLLSLFCLIFRITEGMRHEYNFQINFRCNKEEKIRPVPTEFENLDEMFNEMSLWARKPEAGDKYYFNTTFKFWIPLLKNSTKLSLKKQYCQVNNFKINKCPATFPYEGILKLIKGETKSGIGIKLHQLTCSLPNKKIQKRVKAAAR